LAALLVADPVELEAVEGAEDAVLAAPEAATGVDPRAAVGRDPAARSSTGGGVMTVEEQPTTHRSTAPPMKLKVLKVRPRPRGIVTIFA
jgi:hypothetical protein